jgi:shikimate dehydrogenase
MKQYGLIGKKLSHSQSPQWFAERWRREGVTDSVYRLYEMDSVDNLRRWVHDNDISGFNVTIPYKEAVMDCLDDIDAAARGIGAVNCVVWQDGRLVGHNTDAPAFAETLAPLLRPWHREALVLGTGGAAKAVTYALRGMGIGCTMVSRCPDLHSGAVSYAQAVAMASTHLIIVNATPVGMHPDVEGTPWPESSCIGPRHLCYDLVYNPSPTRFLCCAAERGAVVCGGLAMLHRQAELSWEIWRAAE